jgi:hypothetical protein
MLFFLKTEQSNYRQFFQENLFFFEDFQTPTTDEYFVLRFF